MLIKDDDDPSSSISKPKHVMTCLHPNLSRRPKSLSQRSFLLVAIMGGYIIFILSHFLPTTTLDRLSKKEMSDLSIDCAPYKEIKQHQQLQTATANTPHWKLESSTSTADAISLESATFRILCTSTWKRIHWGSYELRCRDLKVWAHRCAPNVYIQTGISFQHFERRRWIRSILGQLSKEEKVMYHASIFIKSYPKMMLPIYGNMFMDVVDEYHILDDDIPPYVNLILQTKWQGQDMFPSHNYSVVEHWYNSFPADMALMGDPVSVPTIVDHNNNYYQPPLKIATVWNTRRSHDPTEGGCPKLLSVRNVSYHCLDKEFDISKWYVHVMKTKDAPCHMEQTLADPQLGPGQLYYDIFQKYDALVVLAKNHTMKLDYGNVQRTVSQMRSGVPVLVEIRGQVLQDFVDKYNYTCVFARYQHPNTKNYHHPKFGNRRRNKLWTFTEAVEHLKDPNLRRECQRQGLEIVKDYSPSKIGQKFLRTVGYHGDFLC
jgi:hypothetical protein